MQSAFCSAQLHFTSSAHLEVTSSAIQAVNIHLFGLVIYELTLGNYPSLTKQITHALLTGRDATIQLFLSPTPIPQLRIFINTKYHVMA